MRVIAIPIILLGYIITITTCQGGLDRRAYTYTAGSSGAKRLPNYNFGLGKRDRPYSFGLGKRMDDSEYIDSKPNLSIEELRLLLPLLTEEHDIVEEFNSEKRARPYSFGLGKRSGEVSTASEQRWAPWSYNNPNKIEKRSAVAANKPTGGRRWFDIGMGR